MPSGSSGLRQVGQAADVEPVPGSSRKSTSRYSPSDSCAVGRASPKWTLGRGEKPSVAATGSCGPAQRPLPGPGDVAVAGEADLAQLGEPEADPHQARTPSCTGTAPPRPTPTSCWPVPWLPPAGGVADATTCSMP